MEGSNISNKRGRKCLFDEMDYFMITSKDSSFFCKENQSDSDSHSHQDSCRSS